MCAKRKNAASGADDNKSIRQPVWDDALNAISDLVCLLDAKGRITQCSRSLCNLTWPPLSKNRTN